MVDLLAARLRPLRRLVVNQDAPLMHGQCARPHRTLKITQNHPSAGLRRHTIKWHARVRHGQRTRPSFSRRDPCRLHARPCEGRNEQGG
eukprot:1153600-Pelagomonas_calceolata.AAC.3